MGAPMKKSDKSAGAWKRSTIIQGSHVLYVSHAEDEPRWIDAAKRYWTGTMDDLTPVSSSRYAVVHRGMPFPDGPNCYFKRFLLRNGRDYFKHIFRSSRARRALIGGQAVRSRGFRAPRGYCLIESRRFGRTVESALVMEAVDDCPAVSAWIRNADPISPDERAERRQLLKAFGSEVGAWHTAGLYHGDMRLGNILCRVRNGSFDFIWLDNERTRMYRDLPLRRRLQNLVQVNMMHQGMSRTDRLRLWKSYADTAGIPERSRRELARRVAELTRLRWTKRGWLDSSPL